MDTDTEESKNSLKSALICSPAMSILETQDLVIENVLKFLPIKDLIRSSRCVEVLVLVRNVLTLRTSI